ncbi:limbic system-associated membrane protein-like [Chrysoperla carnea]|uniref:limbic system-associated membrane protein-like n=1 Tax=Chrysoperla carnea TaxID=189513 RepID=UPI001D06445A|nr:limbic system-associated membrane protein-like [Chrysoperla carnea]
MRKLYRSIFGSNIGQIGSSAIQPGAIQPKFLSTSRTYRLVIGDTVILPCEVQNLGNYVLVWRKGSTLLSAGNIMVTLDTRFRLLGYQLQIREVDAKDAGDYVCQIGDGTPGDQIHTIEILVPPSVTMSPANGHMTARKGGSVTFECKATGNPSPRIEWSKKNGLLPTGEQSVSGSTLTLTSIERKDAGTYQCTASNGVGQAVFATVQLHVLYPPEVSTDRNWIRSDGVEAQLSCIVHADPQAEIHWYQDSFHLEPTDRRTMETRGNTHTLIIRHLQNSDFGNYSCLVENSLGRTKKYIELTGKPGPVTFLGAPFSKWPNSYNVSWRVDSLPPLQEIRLLYRKLQVNETYQQPGKWHDIILTPPATETLNHEMSYNIRDLEPSSVFEVMIQAKNRFGWSELSQLHQFYTRGLNEINSNDIEDMGLLFSLSSSTFILNKNLIYFMCGLI